MHLEYTPEEVRRLLAEHETLEYASATDADVAEAADVLEGIEELVAKLDPAVRRDELLVSSLPAGDHFWIPVARNGSRAAGVAIDPEGALSFMVMGHEFGEEFPTYFSARQAIAQALLGEERNAPVDGTAEVLTEVSLELSPSVADDDLMISALKASGWAIAAGRTVADVDPDILAALCPLSEAGEAHLFAESGGVVVAMAGSTSGDRRRAAQRLATLPERSYYSRPFSVLLDCGEAGGGYSGPPRLDLIPNKPKTPPAWPYLSRAAFARIAALMGEKVEDPGTPEGRLGALVSVIARRLLASIEACRGAETTRRLTEPFALVGAGAVARQALAKLARSGHVRTLLEKNTGELVALLPAAGEAEIHECLRQSPRTRFAPNAAAREDHYSEKEGWGISAYVHSPRKAELDASAERFKASRFLRPSTERPLDTCAIRRHVRRRALVRAAVRHALAADPFDAGETLRRVVAVVLIARFFSRMIVRRALAAERPWDSKAERERLARAGQRLRQEILTARKARGGEPLTIPSARELDAARERSSERATTRWTNDSVLRSSIERRQKSGRAAYDTARAVYLRHCPELEHKLLHLLRRDGAAPERELLSRRQDLASFASEATDPEAALRSALRSLAEAGKVRRMRSSKTGEIFLAATELLDETGYRRSLNGLIRDARFGIVNPWADTDAVETDGEAEEWEQGTEDLEAGELGRLAPRRLSDTGGLYEQPLPQADLVAEPSAQEEIDSVA